MSALLFAQFAGRRVAPGSMIDSVLSSAATATARIPTVSGSRNPSQLPALLGSSVRPRAGKGCSIAEHELPPGETSALRVLRFSGKHRYIMATTAALLAPVDGA